MIGGVTGDGSGSEPTADDAVNILVVDDHEDKLLVLQTILDDLHENVVTARSGREALKRVLERDFAVILLDVKMPDMDGFETAALIRSRRKLAHTPIIFVTAYEDEVHAAAGYSLGAVDYILAPIVPDVLRTKVRVFVQLHRMRNQIRRQADERIALMREQAARSVAEESIRRSTFLAEASQVLSSSLDVTATMRALTRFVVPFLGDLCALTLVDDGGAARETFIAWQDADGLAVDQLALRAVDGVPAAVMRRALCDTGPHRRDLETDETVLHVQDNDGGRHAIPLGYGVRHVTGFPLRARGRQLGGLLLAARAGRVPDAAMTALGLDLAARTAIALDNGLLYARLQDADRRKDEFLAMLAHELRNPLAPIRTAMAVLRRVAPQDAAVRRSEDIVDRQVEQLTRMVDDLLDVSRLTQGKVRLERTAVLLAAAIEQAIETVRPEIARRRHALVVDLPAEPMHVDGDPVRLSQVFSNLLHNAAKYTAEGGTIRVGAARDGERVVVRVVDDGSGISPDVLPHVFDLFTQANRSLARSEGGLGIGLTVVRSLVERHGGTVEALSDGEGRGSEFVVRLPLTAREGERSVALDAPASASPGRRILLVDDNVDSNEALDLFLRLEGHDVRQAADGTVALDIAREFKPELVLCDIGLPGMDGFEVIRCLRRQEGDAMPPVVALTGYGSSTDRERVQEAGFVQHLLKPVDPEMLKALIATHAR